MCVCVPDITRGMGNTEGEIEREREGPMAKFSMFKSTIIINRSIGHCHITFSNSSCRRNLNDCAENQQLQAITYLNI